MKLKIFAFLLGLSVLVLPVMALADDYGLGDTAAAAAIPTNRTVTQILGDVIGSALSLVSILFFGLMLYAGIKWMLARGDSGQSEEAMSTITYAIIGLVVILASYAITNFVFEKVGTSSPDPSSNASWCYTPPEQPAPISGGAPVYGTCSKLSVAPNTTPACADSSQPYATQNECKEAHDIP